MLKPPSGFVIGWLVKKMLNSLMNSFMGTPVAPTTPGASATPGAPANLATPGANVTIGTFRCTILKGVRTTQGDSLACTRHQVYMTSRAGWPTDRHQ